MSEPLKQAKTPNPSRSVVPRWIVAILIIATAIGLFVNFRDQLTLVHLVARERQFRTIVDNQPKLVLVTAFLAYVTIAAFSIPGAAPTTLLFGWLFGFWKALILVSFASTLGATLACLTSRYVFRDIVQTRFGEQLSAINTLLARQGAYYLLTLRLIPIVPFFVINLVMGLTPISLWTFYWVSQLGMLPGTAIYVYAGANVPSLQTIESNGISSVMSPQLIVGLMLLGLFPWIVKQFIPAGQESPPTHTKGASDNLEC